MKNHFFYCITRTVTLLVLVCLFGCQSPEAVLSPTPEDTLLYKNVGIAEAKAWYDQQMQSKVNGRVNSKANFSQRPRWTNAQQTKFNGADAVIVTFQADTNAPIPRLRGDHPKKDRLGAEEDQISVDQFSDLIIYQKGDKKIAEIITKIPEDDFYKQKNKSAWKFSGLIIISDVDGNFKQGFQFKNGTYKNDIFLEKNQSPNGRPLDMLCPDYVDWYSVACSYNVCTTQFMYTTVTYRSCSSSAGPGSSSSATAYYDATGSPR